jgi:hypothetical protein
MLLHLLFAISVAPGADLNLQIPVHHTSPVTLFDTLRAQPDFFEHKDDPKVLALAQLSKNLAALGVVDDFSLNEIAWNGSGWSLLGAGYLTYKVRNFPTAIGQQAEILREKIHHTMSGVQSWQGDSDYLLQQFNSVDRFVNDLVGATRLAYSCGRVLAGKSRLRN